MSKKILVLISCFCVAILRSQMAQAQGMAIKQPYLAAPAHMWELGIHGGIAMSFGDINPQPGPGAGFHLRKALDYIFSFRGDAAWSKLQQNNQFDGASTTTAQHASLQLLASINNLAWSIATKRKANLYGFVGGGVTRFKVTATKVISPYISSVKPTLQTHVDGGVGVAFRLSSRFNLGLESKALVLFGRNNDLLDGVDREEGDVLGYGSLRLNFNLGKSNAKAEPLYWLNPMATVVQDISELKSRPVVDLTDTDNDGVIDMLDQDNATPPGVDVDTRGLPLDSDGDGIPNYQDEEPYLPAGSKNLTRKEGERPIISEEDVRKVVQDELDKIAKNNERAKERRSPSTKDPDKQELDFAYSEGIANWFLPIIHFNIDSYRIRNADYGNLASIARLMTSNPTMRLVVTGFTDKTASNRYNLTLSYRRASAVVDYLVHVHGIPRKHLIIQYNGEDAPLVPSVNSTLMNRRVEFRAAVPEDVEMTDPMLLPREDGN